MHALHCGVGRLACVLALDKPKECLPTQYANNSNKSRTTNKKNTPLMQTRADVTNSAVGSGLGCLAHCIQIHIASRYTLQ